MGMLDESSMYPIFDMKTKGAKLVGTVWGPAKEMRDVKTKFGEQDFYYIPVLPKGAAPSEENVVTLSVTPGARLAGLSAALREKGVREPEEGATIAVEFYDTKPSSKGNDQHLWRWAYERPANAPAGSMLSEAAASGGSLLD